MVFEGNYKIFVKDENDNFAVCVRMPENGMVARFDCMYAAERYAKEHGIKSGYIIKK